MTRRAGRSRLLLGALVLLLAVLPRPAEAQEPATGDKPTAPGQPPGPTPIPEPIPVIPEPPFPPPTVPSTPQRLLPVPSAGLPPTAVFQLEPSVTLSEEYTDNFNLTKRDKLSNFRSTVSPGLRLLINSAFTKGVVAYTFAPSHDSATDDLQLFHTLLGQVTWEATPLWKLTVADTLTRSDQPAEADRLGLRRERQTFTSNTFSLASDYLLARVTTHQSYALSTFSDDGGGKTTSHTLAASASLPIYRTNSVSVGYDYVTSKTENGTGTGTGGGEFIASTGGDTSGHQFTAAFTRQLTSLRSVGVKGSYALRTLTAETSDTDYRLWNVSVFTNYALLGRLTINGSLGVSGITIDSGESLGPNLFSSTSITYQFGPALASLAMDQGFSETFSGGQNFGVVETTGISGSLTYPFTPSLSGTATASYRRSKATGIGNIETGTGGDQESESYGGTLALSWRILPKLLLDLSYSYLKQVGSGDNQQVGTTTGRQGGGDDGYTENRIKASINVSF